MSLGEPLQMHGLIPPGEDFYRKVFLEMEYDLIPKDPTLQVRVQIGEIGPGRSTDWHIHQGSAFFLVIRGQVVLEHEDINVKYSVGDAFPEPVGIVHRAYNPSHAEPLTAIGFFLTPPGRPPIVPIHPPPDFVLSRGDTPDEYTG